MTVSIELQAELAPILGINRYVGRRVNDEVLIKANEAFSEVFYL
jgi:hypothetical protein